MHRSDIELGHIQRELKLIGLRDISFILCPYDASTMVPAFSWNAVSALVHDTVNDTEICKKEKRKKKKERTSPSSGKLIQCVSRNGAATNYIFRFHVARVMNLARCAMHSP